ncbi:expressed unknown protein [Seminavis robusta]|uniref:Uncharacterized protein n=1 Tax=Seminavis robusta TaxID=568900 RepID=A0A9N8ETJ9_9STRA|nr:expressed unknown protein [Seminavis robusta]|eukprot:Sro1925_g305760.1 n/a (146) ;mRNA; r:694-1131
MVLESFQPLKNNHSQLLGSPSMMRRVSTCSSSGSTGGVSCLNLSSLNLSESHQSGARLSSYSSSSMAQSGSMMRRGWGSTETRRASTSLSTMAGTAEDNSGNGWTAGAACVVPNTNAVPTNNNDKDGWGYFVDVAGDEDEDALMW